jgi:hypothetical protein
MTTHWTCIGTPPATPPCGEGGTYEHNAISGDSGPAWKHTVATGHTTTTTRAQWTRAGGRSS